MLPVPLVLTGLALQSSPGAGLDTEFDWTVKAGETLLFDTVSQRLVDEDNGLVQEVVNGVVVANEVTIEPGARVRAVGPHPLRILATGTVRIGGEIDVSGFPAADGGSFPDAADPEPGGLGAAGGGDGGIGSPETTTSSARGGSGDGPLGFVGAGGQGGESGYDGAENHNYWRPGGGGGGSFGPPLVVEAGGGSEPVGVEAQAGELGFDSTHPGFDATLPLASGATGAETGSIPPAGGAPGASPFRDGTARNDFWGEKVTPGGTVRGELFQLGAGSGGGGGGDAIHSAVFPTPNFVGSSGVTWFDHKGGAGGGGGGALHVVALGEIVLGPAAAVRSDGGRGGAGENASFVHQVGGGGGGGSGGHVVLESGARIVFAEPAEPGRATIRALGGDGGAGMPFGDNPEGTIEFNELVLLLQILSVLGYPVSWGGDGGPGVVQLHVPLPPHGDPTDNLVLPPGVRLGDLTRPRAHVLLPIFLPRVAP